MSSSTWAINATISGGELLDELLGGELLDEEASPACGIDKWQRMGHARERCMPLLSAYLCTQSL